MKNKVVYAWLNAGIPFYIGIGSLRRSQSKRGRNAHCYNKRAKAERENSFEVRILHKNLSWKEACELEQSYISLYGRIDLENGILTNMTDGGDGACNPSKETRKRMSKSMTGLKRSEKSRENMKGRVSGFQGKKHTSETLRKMKQSKQGKSHPRSLPVMTPKGRFESCSLASVEFKCNRDTIVNRARSCNFPNYFLLDSSQT